VEATRQDLEASGMVATILGHVGDGNFHIILLVDLDDPVEVAKAEGIVSRISQRAIAMDGTCTGEHGIGQGKQAYLLEELGGAVAVMRTIKQALDPLNLLNPGKIFSERACS
jgi:D-lactate dehydrogenase (cytochrome)